MWSTMAKKRDYALTAAAGRARIAAPAVAYRPQDPKRYRPPIGLIGCGGITEYHLRAYKAAGYDVVALCDRTLAKARRRQREFYPTASVCTDYREVLRRADIEVVDVATHPQERVAIMRAAIAAGKHVLSQKPFVTDLDAGERLCELADKKSVRLAVNQNGRWAPHFSYLRNSIAQGLIGTPIAAHLAVRWDHNWVKGTPFEQVRHLVLYDFGVHWFDILCCFMGDKTPTRVFASEAVSPSQKAKPPLLAQALVEYDGAQASLVFDADVRSGREDRTFVAGTKGTLLSQGPSLTEQAVTLHTRRGVAQPQLRGSWFAEGFHGAMAELLLAIEQKREPSNGGRNNLKSLALCFAACASADAGRPVIPGTVRRLRK
jgi:predicted dehydrogenase